MRRRPLTIFIKTAAMIRMIRPELPAAAGLCVVVGQFIALGKLPSISSAGLGFLLGFFLSSSAMVFNDYFDLEVDRINAPQRPFPAGLLSQAEVIALGAFTAVAGWVVALAIHPIALFLSLVTWALGFLYNWKAKAAGLWGNLIVSASVGMTFVLGGVSVGQAARPMLWIFALIAFIFDLAEEIAGDAMDIAGDQKRSSRSIAILWGKRTALRISAVLFGGMVLLTIFPVIWGEVGLAYLVPFTLTDALIIFFTYKLLTSQTPGEGRGSMRSLYLCATVGLLAFILGTFIR